MNQDGEQMKSCQRCREYMQDHEKLCSRCGLWQNGDNVSKAPVSRDDARSDLAEVMRLVKSIEWLPGDVLNGEPSSCFVCSRTREMGHKEDCVVYQILSRYGRKTQ